MPHIKKRPLFEPRNRMTKKTFIHHNRRTCVCKKKEENNYNDKAKRVFPPISEKVWLAAACFPSLCNKNARLFAPIILSVHLGCQDTQPWRLLAPKLITSRVPATQEHDEIFFLVHLLSRSFISAFQLILLLLLIFRADLLLVLIFRAALLLLTLIIGVNLLHRLLVQQTQHITIR